MGRAEAGSSFGAAAAQYVEHRPGYARAAVQWALELAVGSRALDLGAGTGKLTQTLMELGADVVAVEPDAAMLAELHRIVPSVRALAGAAEAIPLPDASVDAVVVGNALHWFDMDVAGPEIARVLSPGGVLAGLWNLIDDRVDWVDGLARVGGMAAAGSWDTPAAWRIAVSTMLPSSDAGQFGDPELAEFPHSQLRTAETLAGTLATRSAILSMGPDDREAQLGEIRTYLASRPETAVGTFALPMITGVARVQRT